MIQLLGNLWRKHGGTAAIEFAFALPIMLLMFFGLFEVTQGLIVYMKVIDVADTVSDLVAQQSTVASSDFTNYYTAGRLVMTPSDGSLLSLSIASVIFDPTTGARSVAWQVTRPAGARKMADPTAAAIGLGQQCSTIKLTPACDSVIVAQASYTYNSVLKNVLPKGITISATVSSRPRVVFALPCTAPCN